MISTKSTKFLRRLGPAVVITIIGAGGLTACGKEPELDPTPAEAYVAQIDDALESGRLSDFEQRVLEDHRITDDEMHEAEDLFQQCTADEGVTASVTVTGVNFSYGIPKEEQDRLRDKAETGADTVFEAIQDTVQPCAHGTVSLVGSLYAMMTNNPGDRPFEQLQRDCLEKIGLSEKAASTSDDDLQEAVGSGALGAEASEHCSGGVYTE